MFNLQKKQNKAKVLERLQDFEAYCMGEQNCSPDTFVSLNKTLSRNSVEHIGTYHFKNKNDGKHMHWVGLDAREHDLGCVDHENIMQNYPGFHKTRTHALGKHLVKNSKTIHIKNTRKYITVIEMKDGTTAVGTDYKIALRNAALKMHLKQSFNKKSKLSAWKKICGKA